MGFVQIISFRTDRADEFAAVEQEWIDATEGKRTMLREQSLVDRHDPRHRVQIVEFASYESAMENSHLPETDAIAQKLSALTEGTEFGDYDVVFEYDVRRQLAAGLRHSLETSTAGDEVYAADVAFEGQWPHHVVRGSGTGFVADALRAEASARTVERWDVTTTATGFVAEYAYRTTGEDSRLSMGLMLVTVERGRIARLVTTCGGSWDAAAERQILGLVEA